MLPNTKQLLKQIVDATIESGEDWRAVIWHMRDTLTEIEQDFVAKVYSELEAKIGPVTDEDRATVHIKAEQAIERINRDIDNPTDS